LAGRRNLRKTVSRIIMSLLLAGLLALSTGVHSLTHATTISVAYIYATDLASAQEYKSLLSEHGISVDLVNVSDAEVWDYNDYALIIIGNDVAAIDRSIDYGTISVIDATGRPIIGLGEGGYYFFGTQPLYLAIGRPWGVHGWTRAIIYVDRSHPVLNYAINVSISSDSTIQLYTNLTGGVSIHLPTVEAMNASVIPIGLGGYIGTPANASAPYSSLIQEGRYLLWGFDGSPADMTQSGKEVFVNLVLWFRHVGPVTSFEYFPREPQENEQVTFDASPISALMNITSFEWDFGDNHTATTTGPTIDHTYALKGTYKVSLRVTNTIGTVMEFTSLVQVKMLDEIGQLVESVCGEAGLTADEKVKVIDFLEEAPSDEKTSFLRENIRRQYALSAVSYIRYDLAEPWTSSVSKEFLYAYVVPLFSQCGDFYGLPYEKLDFRAVLTEVAKNITENITDPYVAARTLSSWVFENIKYGPAFAPYTPLMTYQTRQGECFRKSELFIAFCRCIGLPARLVYIQGCTHLAAQVYISAIGWVPADPTILSHLFDVHEGYTFTYSHFWHADAVCPILPTVGDEVTYYYSLDGLHALMTLAENYVGNRTLDSLRTLMSDTENAFNNRSYEEAQAKGVTLRSRINAALPTFTARVIFLNENNETLPFASWFFSTPLTGNLRTSAIWGVTDENGEANVTFRPCYYDLVQFSNDMYHGSINELQVLPEAQESLMLINVTWCEKYCLESTHGMQVTVVDDDNNESVPANVTFVDADTGEEVETKVGQDAFMVLCFREPFIQRRVYVLTQAAGYRTARSTVFTMHFAWSAKPITIRMSRQREVTTDVGEPFTPPVPSVSYDPRFLNAAVSRCDLNHDGIVNILDITIVAKAYGSTPGDPNWDANADSDNNSVINILDISMVARDYGKTV
jgi:PKD repeat protein